MKKTADRAMVGFPRGHLLVAYMLGGQAVRLRYTFKRPRTDRSFFRLIAF